MDLERAKTKSPEELTSIWDDIISLKILMMDDFIWQYHLGRGHIGITMKAQLYRLLEQRAAECRYFVIPLWREMVTLQCLLKVCFSFICKRCNLTSYFSNAPYVEAPHMIFTGLEDYKARGTQAAPYLTSTFYTELSETKDLVFIRGDVVFTSKLTDEEAKWIMETSQSF
uniref:Uncharacterized protein n=1 Tax=Brassica oleracea TaxID=3712 RepID=A0A3P6AIB5_BRAOL|nr:unnamed protein product [Brassica oleracea]